MTDFAALDRSVGHCDDRVLNYLHWLLTMKRSLKGPAVVRDDDDKSVNWLCRHMIQETYNVIVLKVFFFILFYAI